MRKFESRLKKLEEQRPERPPFPKHDPDDNSTHSLFAMIQYSHKYPGPRPKPWDEEKMGCTAQSFLEVKMQGWQDE